MSQLDELIMHMETAEKCIHKLAALVPEWQPIENAPKDGTFILLWPEGVTEFDEDDYRVPDIGRWKEWLDQDGPQSGWDNHNCGDSISKPSHWMPLPLPPKIDA